MDGFSKEGSCKTNQSNYLHDYLSTNFHNTLRKSL